MNLSLAFFHGEQALVALGLAGAIIVISVPLVFYIWLWRTKSSPRTLTVTYAISTAVLCALTALSADDPFSLFYLTVSTLAGILTLPWNLLTVLAIAFANNSDISHAESVVALLLGGGVNTMIVFFLAKKARGWS